MNLAWDSTSPRLVDPNSGGFVVGEPHRQAVLFEGDVEVARLPVSGDQPLDLSAYAHPDRLYRIDLDEDGTYKGSLTFRALEPEEAGELSELTLTEEVKLDDRLERMDRFSDLGQYHQAAYEGRCWLLETDLQADPEQSAAVLQLVYDLNRDILHDARQTQFWSDWALIKKLPLIQ